MENAKKKDILKTINEKERVQRDLSGGIRRNKKIRSY